MREFTVRTFRAQFKPMKKELRKALRTPVSKATRAARKDVKSRILKSTFGRGIWKGKIKDEPGRPRFMLSRSRVRRSTTLNWWVGSFKLSGMAAMIDLGGRLRRHTIKPKSASKLVFAGTGGLQGQTVVTRSVSHPGAVVRRQNIVKPALNRASRRLVPETIDGLQRVRAKFF